MTPETQQTIANIIILVLTAIGGGGVTNVVMKSRQENRNYKQLFEDVSTERMELRDKLEDLTKVVNEQGKTITMQAAKLDFVTAERDTERKAYLSERDEIMKRYGAVEQQIADLTKRFNQLDDEKRELMADNKYLEETNRELQSVKARCEQTTRENERLQRELTAANQQISDLKKRLEKPDPPTPVNEAQQPQPRKPLDADAARHDATVDSSGEAA